MKAIVLAAGYATRLYPLTLDKPKALLPINNKPILDYIVNEINTIDKIDMIYVVSNHKFYPHFCEWAENAPGNVSIKVLDDGTTSDENKKGAIGDIYFTLDTEKIDDDIMVIAGDNFFNYKLKDYYDFYKKMNADCIIVKELDDIALLKQFAVVTLDETDKVLDLVEKPEDPITNLAVYATYFYKRDTLPLFKKYLDEGNKPDSPGYFPQWLYKLKDVYAYPMPGECYDIGTHSQYEEVQRLCKNI